MVSGNWMILSRSKGLQNLDRFLVDCNVANSFIEPATSTPFSTLQLSLELP